ncbi:MAG TPA: RNA polymerase sigma factor [Gemmatimonadaceae bacterium]
MPDEEAVTRVLAGEVDAFAVLVRRYRDTFARFATRMVGSEPDAEDVVQSAFVRAYRALERCRRPEHFAAWLYQIVLNECRSYTARRARRERWYEGDEETLASIPVEIAPMAEEDDGPSLHEIQRALDRLPVEQREAFVLKHVEEVSYEDMSRITGVGVSALKMRVKRACARLRELLEEVAHD